MNKNIVIIALVATLMGIILPTYSQTQPNNFKVASERIVREGNQVSISMNFILDEMTVENNDMVILTPTLKANGTNGETLSLSPIAITGKVRNKIITRKQKLGHSDDLPFKDKPQTILERKNNTSQSVNYVASVPYMAWMDNASLSVSKSISGCANCSSDAGDQLIVQNVLPKRQPAYYKLTYITPKAEPVKVRTDSHTATFNYTFDSYKLLKDYKNNNAEFAQIDKVIAEIKDNEDLQVTEFAVVGYASPEGRFDYNRKLAENRAKSFANYLVTKLGVSQDKFTVEGKGEDWDGLCQAVSNSNMTDKSEILNIVDKVQNPDARDKQLKKLSNGTTYRNLLRNYYPQLRRTEYVIAYNVRAFDVEEARQIIKTNPKLLSLNEMYLVAESYPANSKEFKDVYDIATRLYPDSEAAIVNLAAADIENKNYDRAIERLTKIEDNPIAWNNLGVAYALKNNIEKASEYFKKASGDAEAKANYKIMQEAGIAN